MAQDYRPGRWVMTSIKEDRGLTFLIGQVRVARVEFADRPVLHFWGDNIPATAYPDVSSAMKAMHVRLTSPPPERGTT